MTAEVLFQHQCDDVVAVEVDHGITAGSDDDSSSHTGDDSGSHHMARSRASQVSNKC